MRSIEARELLRAPSGCVSPAIHLAGLAQLPGQPSILVLRLPFLIDRSGHFVRRIAVVRKKAAQIFAVFLACVALSNAAQAEIYRWVDESGNIHFSDRPSRAHSSEEVKLQILRQAKPGRGGRKRMEH